jgi:hypothetical protein
MRQQKHKDCGHDYVTIDDGLDGKSKYYFHGSAATVVDGYSLHADSGL